MTCTIATMVLAFRYGSSAPFGREALFSFMAGAAAILFGREAWQGLRHQKITSLLGADFERATHPVRYWTAVIVWTLVAVALAVFTLKFVRSLVA